MFLLKKKYQIANIYNSIFKENFKKKLNFDWVKYPERHDIIKKIIEKKKYSSYLEIGCFQGNQVREIFKTSHWTPGIIHQDLSGKDRFFSLEKQ